MKAISFLLPLALLHALHAEEPFKAVPDYTPSPVMDEDAVGDRKLVKLEKPVIDEISNFVQGFYQKCNTKKLAEVIGDPEITNYLTEDFVKRINRSMRVAKASGEIYFIPGHSESNDLFKYLGAFSTEQKDQYLTDFAVGSTRNDEQTYESHMWVVIVKTGDSWRISDIRDMGNG